MEPRFLAHEKLRPNLNKSNEAVRTKANQRFEVVQAFVAFFGNRVCPI